MPTGKGNDPQLLPDKSKTHDLDDYVIEQEQQEVRVIMAQKRCQGKNKGDSQRVFRFGLSDSNIT
jgi:hypothetical protein